MKRILPLLLCLLCAPLAGCPSQQQDASVLTGVVAGIKAYEIVYGTSPAADKAITIAQLAAADISSYVPGTNNQTVVQVLQDASTAIAAIAQPDNKAVQLIALLASTVASELSLYQPPVAVPAIAVANSRGVLGGLPATAEPTLAAFKAQWGAVAGNDKRLKLK